MTETYALELDPHFAVTRHCTPPGDAIAALALLLGTLDLACAEVHGADLLLWFDPAGHAHHRAPNPLASAVLAKLTGGPTMTIHGHAVITGGPPLRPRMLDTHRCNQVLRDLFGITPFDPPTGNTHPAPDTTA
jgi:hypothetical protein